MAMDKVILIDGAVILLVGVTYTIQHQRPVTPVFVGAVGLLLVTSLMQLGGPVLGGIGKALLSLATFSVVIAEGSSLFSALKTAQNKAA